MPAIYLKEREERNEGGSIISKCIIKWGKLLCLIGIHMNVYIQTLTGEDVLKSVTLISLNCTT